MLLLPAIDLMSGQAVRLRQGRASEKTVYSDDPVGLAQRWEREGGDYLHVVDLDAAFTGERSATNKAALRAILAAITIPCELGGGLRDRAAIEEALALGVSRVVIGTRAAESMAFVAEMAAAFGSERVAVGIDAKDGRVAVRGWTESSPRLAIDLAREAEAAGAGTIIYTDIATDGMLTGPNFAELDAVLAAVRCQVIASGGVSSAADIHRLAERKDLYGAIIGRALYEGTLQLAECTKSV